MPKKDTRARTFGRRVRGRGFLSGFFQLDDVRNHLCVCVNSHDDGLKKARNRSILGAKRTEPARRRGIRAGVRTASGVRDAVDEDGDADSDTV